MIKKGLKKFKTRIGLRLGGDRIGIIGAEEIRHPVYSIKCLEVEKTRFPKMIKNKYYQALKNCPKGKKPLLIIKEKRRLDDNALVVISLLNFEKLFFGAYPWYKNEN